MKTKNLAKGRKINKTIDFCKVFSDLSVDNKMIVIKNLEKCIKTGKKINKKGEMVRDLYPNEIPAIKQLINWAYMNIFIGGEMCPPEDYINY